MKKIKFIILFFVLMPILISCTDLPTGGKGIEIYCWEIKEEKWRCGAMRGTNMVKPYNQIKIIQNNLYTLPKMKNKLLNLSEEERNSVRVILIDYPVQKVGEVYNYLRPEDYPNKYIFLYSELELIVPEYLYLLG